MTPIGPGRPCRLEVLREKANLDHGHPLGAACRLRPNTYAGLAGHRYGRVRRHASSDGLDTEPDGVARAGLAHTHDNSYARALPSVVDGPSPAERLAVRVDANVDISTVPAAHPVLDGSPGEAQPADGG
jgi:hypothetical protein